MRFACPIISLASGALALQRTSLLTIVLWRDPQAHRNHRRLSEAVFSEKCLGHVFGAIGQQSDTEKVFLLRKIDGVLEKFGAVALALVLLMNHQVLQHHDEAAFGCADGEKQIDHAHDRAVASQHENASAARLFENEPQTTKLFVLIRPKIAFLSEQFAQHSRELVQIGLGRWLNYDVLAHGLQCLWQKSESLAIL